MIIIPDFLCNMKLYWFIYRCWVAHLKTYSRMCINIFWVFLLFFISVSLIIKSNLSSQLWEEMTVELTKFSVLFDRWNEKEQRFFLPTSSLLKISDHRSSQPQVIARNAVKFFNFFLMFHEERRKNNLN